MFSCLPFSWGLSHEKVTVDGRQYAITAQIGEGGFATIHTVKADNDVLVLKKCRIDSERARTTTDIEIDMLSKIGHPDVIPLISFSREDPREVLLIQPYYELGSVDHYVKHKAVISQEVVTTMAKGLLRALGHLHSLKYAHRDVKSANVLVASEAGTVVLADFGSACYQCKVHLKTSHDAQVLKEQIEELTSEPYRAPELLDVIKGTKIDWRKADVWAAACVIFEIMSEGEQPFASYAARQGGVVSLCIAGCQYEIPERTRSLYSDSLLSLFEVIFVEARKRPQVVTILQSPVFN